MFRFRSIFATMIILTGSLYACNKDNNESSSDITAPVITILGVNPIYSQRDSTYVDPGATAHDDVDGDITGNIETTSNVDIYIDGDYTVTYRVSDRAGNLADTFRIVKVRVF
ncbi:MAG: DUF5011 domain-containing protein [Bacteroidota bacterium]|nr:DUF5011 domain-containing protein [Bacteroidota bacterium]